MVGPLPACPNIYSITPDSQSTCDGGQLVTIFGDQFIAGDTEIWVSNAKFQATHVNVLSDTQLTCRMPAGWGTVDVSAKTTPGGSVLRGDGSYTYASPEVVVKKFEIGTSSEGIAGFNDYIYQVSTSAPMLAPVVAIASRDSEEWLILTMQHDIADGGIHHPRVIQTEIGRLHDGLSDFTDALNANLAEGGANVILMDTFRRRESIWAVAVIDYTSATSPGPFISEIFEIGSDASGEDAFVSWVESHGLPTYLLSYGTETLMYVIPFSQ